MEKLHSYILVKEGEMANNNSLDFTHIFLIAMALGRQIVNKGMTLFERRGGVPIGALTY